MKRWWILLGFLLFACSPAPAQDPAPMKVDTLRSANLDGTWYFYNLDRVTPEFEWYLYHRQVTGCLNRTLPFNNVFWFVADSIVFAPIDTASWQAGGMFRRPNEIYLKRQRVYGPYGKLVVKHELIHYILQAGHSVIPTSVFDKCAYGIQFQVIEPEKPKND